MSFCSIVALALTACPGDDTPADETTGTQPTETGDGDGDASATDTQDTESDTDTASATDTDTDTATDTDANPCGNGELDEGEECDDGNGDENDGCSSTCTVTSCGLRWSARQDIESSTNGGFDVAVGEDGSVYTTGVIVNETNDIWVAKWNPDGSVAWSQSFDSGGIDGGLALAATPERVFVGGWVDGEGEDIWYASLDEADGAEQWSVIVASEFPGEDDFITGVAVDGNGDLILSGRIRAGDGDDDVWIRKASAADGSELWTTTWSGAGNGMFSVDRSAEVAVGGDNSIWVAAREYYTGTRQEATVLHFEGDGTFVAAYQPGSDGSDHSHDPIDVAVGSDGVYFGFEDFDFPYSGWLYKLGFDGSEQWLKTEQDWLLVGEDWRVRGFGIDGEDNLAIVGIFDNEEAGEGIQWGEAWTAKLDGAGEIVCRSQHMVDDGAFLPPDLSIDGAGASAGGLALTGIETANQTMALKLWTGYFLP